MSIETKEMAKIAVFDLDGTCISGQSGSLFSKYLFFHGYLSIPTVLKLGWWAFRYVTHLPYSQLTPREAIFYDLQNLKCEKVDELMRDFHDEVLLPRYRKDAIAEIEKRKNEGCIVLLVSATFETIAEAAGQFLGVDDVIATIMEKDQDDHYLPVVSGKVCEGEEKPKSVARWAELHIKDRPWQITYAYGDHHSDEELLEAAHHAFAVCPGFTLKGIANRHGWTLLKWK